MPRRSILTNHRVHYLFALPLLAALTWGGPARANADNPNVAPRTTVRIGGISVVLISDSGKLHAFLDRLEDNAPAEDAQLTIVTTDGKPVAMTRASNGLFVAPFDPAGRVRDSFIVSVTAPEGSGDTTAEIAYPAPPGSELSTTDGGLRDKILIALAAAGLGVVLGSVAVRRWSQRRHQLRPV